MNGNMILRYYEIICPDRKGLQQCYHDSVKGSSRKALIEQKYVGVGNTYPKIIL